MTEAPGIPGWMLLNDAGGFGRTILYLTDEQYDAYVLASVVTHVIDAFTTVPRLGAYSDIPQQGKSTLLDGFVMLGWNAWEPDATSFALRAKFNEREKPFPIFDEISDVYGQSGMRSGNKELNSILKKGYRNTATLSLAVDRSPAEVSSYCVCAWGGLRNAVPNDIWQRSITWKMKAAPEGTHLRDSLDEDTRLLGATHRDAIHQWARAHQREIKLAFKTFRRPHRTMRSRLRQIWGPLYAVALVAGGDWPERCIAAYKAMALDASDAPVLSGESMILRDTAALFGQSGAKKLFTREIRDHLFRLDVELYEKLTPEGLARLLTAALGPAQAMTIGGERAKGFHGGPVLAAWKRLEAQMETGEDDEEEPDEFEDFFEVTEVTHVTAENSNEVDDTGIIDVEFEAAA
jgi:Protein of unknown function (DUF3631)